MELKRFKPDQFASKSKKVNGKDDIENSKTHKAITQLDKFLFGIKTNEKPEKVKYEFTVPETGVKLHEDVYKLTSFDQNLFECRHKFLEQCDLTG